MCHFISWLQSAHDNLIHIQSLSCFFNHFSCTWASIIYGLRGGVHSHLVELFFPSTWFLVFSLFEFWWVVFMEYSYYYCCCCCCCCCCWLCYYVVKWVNGWDTWFTWYLLCFSCWFCLIMHKNSGCMWSCVFVGFFKRWEIELLNPWIFGSKVTVLKSLLELFNMRIKITFCWKDYKKEIWE